MKVSKLKFAKVNEYADRAIEIIEDMHTERLDYNSEYIPLIDAAHTLKTYEEIGTVEEFAEWKKAQDEGRLVVLPYTLKFGDGRLSLTPYGRQGEKVCGICIADQHKYIEPGTTYNNGTINGTTDDLDAILLLECTNPRSIDALIWACEEAKKLFAAAEKALEGVKDE